MFAPAAIRAVSRFPTASHWWSRAKEVPAKYPFSFGVVVSGVKTSVVDLLVQKIVERKEEIDWRRNAAFATFGFVYLGGVQYAIYVPFFGKLFPNAASFASKTLREKIKDFKGIRSLGVQLFLDQCVHHPAMYFPAFYATKELIMCAQNEDGKPDFSKAYASYKENLWDDMVALWKIWVPATFVNFAFMPMHMRIPYTATVSLAWTCVLSSMRGGDAIHSDDMVGGAVTGHSYEIFKEGLDAFNTTPVEMDSNLDHLSISAAGKDRPGMVAQLATHVASQGGNVTHSKMVRLGEEFIIQMHVAVPKEGSQSFAQSLKSNDELKELDIQATKLSRRDTKKGGKAVMGMKIHCVGIDRPGILADVTSRIAEKGMSLEDVSTSVRLSSTGQREFVVDALASSPNIKDKENLDQYVADIKAMEQDLQLSTMDIRVHTS